MCGIESCIQFNSKHVHKRFLPLHFFVSFASYKCVCVSRCVCLFLSRSLSLSLSAFIVLLLFIMRASYIQRCLVLCSSFELRVILSEHAKRDICSVQCTSRYIEYVLCVQTNWWPIIYDYYTQNKYCGRAQQQKKVDTRLELAFRGSPPKQYKRWLRRWFNGPCHRQRIVTSQGFSSFI